MLDMPVHMQYPSTQPILILLFPLLHPPRQAVIKIIVLGLAFNGPRSYLRSAWNILDIFVVIVNILILVLQSYLNANDIIWLRAFRAFRFD